MKGHNVCRYSLPLFAFCLPLAMGCGGSEAKVTMSGTVTVNGQPLENGRISFTPEESKSQPAGDKVTKGHYEVAGVVVGKNRVRVVPQLDQGEESSGE